MTERERFKIWELARNYCMGQDYLSFQQLIHNVQDDGLLVSFVPHSVIVVGEAFTYASKQSDWLFVVTAPRPSRDSPLLRPWMKACARELYNCHLIKHTKCKLKNVMSKQIKPDRPKAEYFADIIVSHLVPESEALPVASAPEEMALVNDPMLILRLVYKLRQNRVLILGKYPGEGGIRISRIQDELMAMNLHPVVFGDLADSNDTVLRDEVKQEVLTVAKLSQFVLIEDSEASGHLLELSDLNIAMVTTAVLRKEGMGSTILTKPYFKKSGSFMKEFTYTNENLARVLRDVLAWAKGAEDK